MSRRMGDKDNFIPVEYAHGFGSKQVTVLPDAGHWVALAAPDALAAEGEAIGQSRESKCATQTPRSRPKAAPVSDVMLGCFTIL
jgi:hypothetical protein